MSRVCQLCGRGSLKSYTRSHSNIATKRRQHLNLQKATINGKQVKACTRCLRTQARRLSKE